MTEPLEIPEPSSSEIPSIDTMIGETVKIVEIEMSARKRQWPIVELEDGTKLLCDNDWASRTATYLYGTMRSQGRDDFTLTIVKSDGGEVGFKE